MPQRNNKCAAPDVDNSAPLFGDLYESVRRETVSRLRSNCSHLFGPAKEVIFSAVGLQSVAREGCSWGGDTVDLKNA